ncbi:thiolase family protein [Alicyclobacillus cycloheptanicus]|uniref:Acetyl-CoA acyltransferase n=1 Tax=Alicyclobacillus cycloheptanicus TaxID=1457 RepID=A0ABT9XJ40_9BACL|nr:thiolase family protein [Alicyclobacillus cycloheptanicus]MDQ0190217.1 acetyl-CoA acyltransferase [Alicyclobacillus cycloheptanicus]
MVEAVIVDAVRTPVGRRKGALKNTHPVDLLGHVLKQLVERNGIDPALVDDVIVGCVDQIGEQAANIGRNAWLSAGLPESVPATTLDRQCGSSLQAAHFAAQGVMAGAYDLVIAGGVEAMTRVPMLSTIQSYGTPLTEDLKRRYDLQAPWFDQAVGAERIARQWGFSRADLDAYSYQSHQRAGAARAAGRFNNEIVPVQVRTDGGETVWFDADEGIRLDTTLEKMAALAPAFPGLERITAGNASQISDGASAVLIASKETAARLGLKPRARFVSFSVVGVDPVTMLTGPIPATKKALQRAGLNVSDIDLFEVNEAFASVVLAWQRETNAPFHRVNVHGGAIALGHPLGATGTRILSTLVNALEQHDKRYGLVAICEGGGMANATIIERLDG